ncbi:MAG: glycosyltransferase, partial [bacterium]
GTIIPLREDYNLAINSAKIALVFLSKLNNDTYTRRVFEIIATKRLMVSVYTDDLNSLFENKKEAVYFNNKEDLVTKIKYYLNNESEYCSIVENGFNRLMSDGHEVQDRAQEILRIYNKLRNE